MSREWYNEAIGFSIMVIACAKLLSFLLKLFSIGSGATWPGEVALRLWPSILSFFSGQNKTIIVVAGTNGKTTTVKMIETILKNAGKKVARNATGANLDNGLVSTFLKHSTISGKLTADYYIFEVDEATVPNIIEKVNPKFILLMNLFRDQLDRYGEVDAISEKWFASLTEYEATHSAVVFVINGDDPHLAYIGMQLGKNVTYFGLEDPELFLPKMQHATDSIYCPKCGNRLTFGGVYFSHLGKYACGQCGFTHPGVSLRAKDVKSPLEGVYNVYNTLAATLLSRTLGFDHAQIDLALESFTPAFGRMEEKVYNGKRVKILLSKNPTGFNESIRTVLHSQSKGPILIVLNDRIPDGRDVSWIWDVDFEILRGWEKEVSVSGDRAWDMAVRLKYAGVNPKQMSVDGNLAQAIYKACAAAKDDEKVWILPTYSAMLDVRKIIVGRKIL